MIYYLYEGHLGSAYFMKSKLSYNETYCDSCGDSDIFLEVSDFDELETAKEVFNEYVEIVGNIYENPELVEEE
ncbi:hypothetical protein KJR36_03610 [Streptococcus infantarius subsp. infantarius]|uniref:hypothetical protein n=1 Tax=Streptococcus infantarius TaxID=102684 RepID=UPI001BDA7475|nr:hypothetical protein [Streptococcus infantarius]MBT0903776.1 hypothetical protein [Streptococcus infantarius subsp. infantarius]MBT0917689.1 hypothetical protein [Streptococcus infantarius subsp. infantarius]